MKLSDKYLLSIIEEIGPKSVVELHDVVKKRLPYVDMANIERRVTRLQRSKRVLFNKKGKVVSLGRDKDSRDKDKDKGKGKGKGKDRYKDKGKRRVSLSQDDFYEICKKYEYPLRFKRKEIAEARSIPLRIDEKEIANRKDLRKQLPITIDGSDAKDLDDAVYIETKGKSTSTLFVHIADVSHYVKENSTLDKEALRRGNSVYLIDKVIPMLPPIISNTICSLNESEDRLCMSAEIDFDNNGNVLKYSIYKSIIRIAKRFTYEEVAKILQQDRASNKEQEPFVELLKQMNDLAQILYKKRLREGSVIFKFKETKILCDGQSNPIDIRKKEPLVSNSIIEEFMLSANRVVAEFLSDYKVSIYRIHDKPDDEKINAFNKMIAKLGYKVTSTGSPKQQELQKILDRFEKDKASKLVNIMLLKSMQQAIYSVDNAGHFALGFSHYTHFTSPIRRYCDLMLHRILKSKLSSDAMQVKHASKEFLRKATEHISTTERTAVLAEREIVKKKSARFMKNKVGHIFDGTVSGITDFGIFVEIEPYGIEGLIRLADLSGYYIFDAEDCSLERKDKKILYRLGQKIKIKLASVNVERTFIDLIPMEPNVLR